MLLLFKIPSSYYSDYTYSIQQFLHKYDEKIVCFSDLVCSDLNAKYDNRIKCMHMQNTGKYNNDKSRLHHHV